jgi:hypothetical protein
VPPLRDQYRAGNYEAPPGNGKAAYPAHAAVAPRGKG